MTALELRGGAATIEEHPGVLVIAVDVSDEAHPDIDVKLEYASLPGGGDLRLWGYEIQPSRPAGGIQPHDLINLSPGYIRDLPLARWDRSARALAQRLLADAEKHRWRESEVSGGAAEQKSGQVGKRFRLARTVVETEAPDIGTGVQDQRAIAEAAVRRMRPDLDPEDSKGARRTWDSLVRYAEVYQEYNEHLIRGTRDAIGEIAERHGVEKATVRSWLHRADRAGIDSAVIVAEQEGLSESERTYLQQSVERVKEKRRADKVE